MTEAESMAWIEERFGAAALARLQHLVDVITAEASRQNLIAPSTVATIWDRHVVDSAQLLALANKDGDWLDIGSGAGFPGLVIAALTERMVWLVEPRRKRAEFLLQAVEALSMSSRVQVRVVKVEAVAQPAAIISARAVAPLWQLFEWAQKCASKDTLWILPKGRSAHEEVAIARQTWHGKFHVEHSITDPDSMIVIASGVARR